MRFLPCAAVLLLLSCQTPQEPVETTASTAAAEEPGTLAPEPSTQEQPRQETPRQDQPLKEIAIESVDAANPVVVRGLARTFENAVSLRARNAKGEVIAEEHVTARGDMGTHNPFDAQLWITSDPGDRITVEAFEYSAKDGSIRSLTSKTVPFAVERITAVLMFATKDCTTLASFERRLPKSTAMARLLVEALLRGPTPGEKTAGATSPFPQGSDLRSVALRGSELTVDFNERLQNVGGSCAAQAIRASVTGTLLRLPTVDRVRITAAGSEPLALQP